MLVYDVLPVCWKWEGVKVGTGCGPPAWVSNRPAVASGLYSRFGLGEWLWEQVAHTSRGPVAAAASSV